MPGHGLMNIEEQRMGRGTVGVCWFLMVVTEKRNMEVLGSWTMLGTCLENREREKHGQAVVAILVFNWFWVLGFLSSLKYLRFSAWLNQHS